MIVYVIVTLGLSSKKVLDLPDNTVCCIDDISIPHSCYPIEDINNKLYIKRVYNDTQTTGTI